MGKDGPFHYRAPSMMIKRMVRGMLPNKIQAALKTVRSLPGRKIASLGRLCHEVGWQYKDVVERLEAKRMANAAEWYKKSQAKAGKKAQAAKAVAAKTAKVDAELAAMGY